MVDWKSYLNRDPTDWLLGEDNPSVRYFTLRDILDRREDDFHVTRSKRDIMLMGVVPRILAKQDINGCWGNPAHFYSPGKYKGTSWQLIILAELGADTSNTKVKEACECILERSQDRLSGGFSSEGNPVSGGEHTKILPCLTGNMVWSLLMLGYKDDPRLKKGVEWITEYQRFDDGDSKAAQGWPYTRRSCWGKHSCHMGVVKALKALAEIPREERTREVCSTLDLGVEYLLKHHVFRRSHDLTQISKPEWLQFGFPLMWHTDVLEILGILTGLGIHDDRMEEAIGLVISRQDEEGRWVMEHSYNGRFQVDIEHKGRQSKWVTLNALKVLKKHYS